MAQQPPDPSRPGDYSTQPTWQPPPPNWQQQPPPQNWQQPAPPPYAYGPQRRTNAFAITSLVLGIVWVYWIGSVLAVIFGHLALRQIRESNETQEGRGLAIAGLVLGYIGVGILAIFILVLVISAATGNL